MSLGGSQHTKRGKSKTAMTSVKGHLAPTKLAVYKILEYSYLILYICINTSVA